MEYALDNEEGEGNPFALDLRQLMPGSISGTQSLPLLPQQSEQNSATAPFLTTSNTVPIDVASSALCSIPASKPATSNAIELILILHSNWIQRSIAGPNWPANLDTTSKFLFESACAVI
ncbi:hypothetical protein JAK51_13640 [Stenotrophomonas maltophilia]|uniref:hypothetical protein n=1 Tax=Stenotrophomonas maltophilia TaxID=40324 RepID=UPI0021C72BB9|nr:hypothetical protein [Stenotrophomonas maltophilia]MCU1127259.1 hypothetical protein [Stenotrophomonas maltophilia]